MAAPHAVIGGGLAGLTTAAVLARAGEPVTLFEREPEVGGLARLAGPMHPGGLGRNGWLLASLQAAGADRHLELTPQQAPFEVRLPGARFLLYSDPDRLRHELAALWPAEAAGLAGWLTVLEQRAARVLAIADGLSPAAGEDHPTLGSVLQKVTRDPTLSSALSALWLLAGLPPRLLSFQHLALLWDSLIRQGGVRAVGGIEAVVRSLERAAAAAGARVQKGEPVERILRRKGEVLGVRLSTGEELETASVIASASPRHVFEDLLRSETEPPAGYPPLRGSVTGSSALVVHLELPAPPSLPAPTVLAFACTDPDEAFLDGQRQMPEFLAIVAATEPGETRAVVWGLVPYSRPDHWHVPYAARDDPSLPSSPEAEALKQALAGRLVAQLRRQVPELGEVQVGEVLSPVDLEHRTRAAGGSAFGWAALPEQSGTALPGPATSFRRLYLAGHWVFPGTGAAGASLAGYHAARMVLETSRSPNTTDRPPPSRR